MSQNRYQPISESLLTLVYAGAHFKGGKPEEFRLLCQVADVSSLLEPFWAGGTDKVIFQGRLPRKANSLTVKLAIEPNSSAFSLGGNIHAVNVDLWCAEYPASGYAISSPVRLRTTESLVTKSQEISVQFAFRWHLHSPIQDTLGLVMDQLHARAGMHGIRVLARRLWEAEHVMQKSQAADDGLPFMEGQLLHRAVSRLYFAHLMRKSGPMDLDGALRTMLGDYCLDATQALLYPSENWNALQYGYLAAAAGLSEDEVMSIPDLAEAYKQLETIGLKEACEKYLQVPGDAWLHDLRESPHLRAELRRIGQVLMRDGISPRADLCIPNALVLGYDLGKSLNGRKKPNIQTILPLVREAGLPAIQFQP